jgi:hypothetical protein
MRVDDMKTFKYVLKRGVSPLAANENDMNTLHFAIILEKLNFISYLLEGDYDAHLEKDLDKKYERLIDILS